MEALARQFQSYVDGYRDPDNVSWADSRFYIASRRAGEALVMLGSMLPVKSRISRKPNMLNDVSADVSGGTLGVLAATVLALEAKSRRQDRMVLIGAKLTRAAVEAVEMLQRQVAGTSGHRQNDVCLSWPQRSVPPAASRRVA